MGLGSDSIVGLLELANMTDLRCLIMTQRRYPPCLQAVEGGLDHIRLPTCLDGYAGQPLWPTI